MTLRVRSHAIALCRTPSVRPWTLDLALSEGASVACVKAHIVRALGAARGKRAPLEALRLLWRGNELSDPEATLFFLKTRGVRDSQ